MSAPPGITAVVITHRSAGHLERCLRALQPQLARPSDLVVWDNASEDGSAQLARAVSPGAVVLAHSENIGFAAAVNAAAKLISGRDLLLVNPDAVLEPTAVARLVHVLSVNPRAAVVGALVQEEHRRMVSAWRYPTASRAVMGALVGLGRAYGLGPTLAEGPVAIPGSFVPFTAAVLRRVAFDQLGGLDEAFWLYGEDTDYCYRAELAGWQVVLDPRAGVRHAGRGSSGDPSAALRYQLQSGDRFRRKHSGRAGAELASLALFAGAAARVVIYGLGSKLGLASGPRASEWSWVLRHYLHLGRA